ncbi:LysM peptidoglycan-binding domain-containing protein [Paenibacillus polymyxa]|uniref:LysM peptidoglycan-binding domain-containing protein n=1 Tax=Paenibacillus polymyxa TaxID=1406 RepID=UPI0004D8DBFB|nr:LysM peptidoglycan-binding domain-containing protein [Paenibacillus polymyxa]KEO80113.1 terminase [Paenibacillus polymyxa]MCH6186215.1 LysM peptidoglycan-binding domain-containing protein [Paenibacillus polymyxa]MDY8091543.1 LysM peptidoglycan-binding domain-containing protein [Paenibacillus polymyxa]WRL60780.1 LysM peptidoglycan-binding domain-containing protein [Paenibacillus polymyxa]
MEFSLTDGKGKKFQFPVNPEEVTISRQKGFDTTTILSYGEFDFPQGEKVKEISFSSFFPKEYNPAYCTYEDIPDPQEAMNTLNGFLLSKNPLRFIITETAVNVPVIVASHNSTFRGGEYGDVNFDLSLRTWREMKISKKAGSGSKSATVNKKPRTDMKEKKKTYTVKSGDSLSKIAKLELGDSSQWSRIYQLNKKVIGQNPNAIKPGQKLVLS